MSSEFDQRHVWKAVGVCRVTSELFMDVVFTSACECACPFCISRTRSYAPEDPAAWERALEDAFSLFDIRSVIILGGEATCDARFWDKLERAMAGRGVEHLILTTNGVRLRDADFAARLLDSPHRRREPVADAPRPGTKRPDLPLRDPLPAPGSPRCTRSCAAAARPCG